MFPKPSTVYRILPPLPQYKTPPNSSLKCAPKTVLISENFETEDANEQGLRDSPWPTSIHPSLMAIAVIEVPLIQIVLPLRVYSLSPPPSPNWVHKRSGCFPDSLFLYVHRQARADPWASDPGAVKKIVYFSGFFPEAKGKVSQAPAIGKLASASELSPCPVQTRVVYMVWGKTEGQEHGSDPREMWTWMQKKRNTRNSRLRRAST